MATEDSRERQLAEAEALNAITAASLGEDDPQRLLDNALTHLAPLVPFTGGSLALIEGDHLVIRAARGPFAATALGQRVPQGSWAWNAITHRETLLSNDLASDGRKATTPIRSFLAVPLAWRGRNTGLLEVDSTEANAFRDRDARLLERAAIVLAGPTELLSRYQSEMRALKEAQANRERLTLLSEASVLLAQSLQPERTLESITRLVVPRLADWCAIYLAEDGPGLPVAVTHQDESKVALLWEMLRRYPPDPEAPGGSARVLRDGVVSAIPSIPDEMIAASARDPEHHAMLRDLGIGSLVVVPMIARGRVTGAIALASRQRGRHGPDDVSFLEELARRAGLALDNARLFADNEAARAELEDRVRERTRELEERNAEQETFIYTASHDLRTPLLSISGMSDLLLDAIQRHDSEEAEFLIGRVQKNVARMGQLLSDLLALSRIGRVTEQPDDLDLGDTVMTTLSQFLDRITARELEVTAPSEWPQVRYPRSELDQVVTNLLGNAIKWAGRPGEHPSVQVEWERTGKQVRLSVHDNGPGVPPEYREKVFALFQRLDPKTEGTGVGLAIVRRIAERHGGKAWVDDSPLGGARFTVTLPAGE